LKNKDQKITEFGGFVQGVYMSKEQASEMARMVRKNLDHMIETSFSSRLKVPSVILYIETIEDKISQALNVANFVSRKNK